MSQLDDDIFDDVEPPNDDGAATGRRRGPGRRGAVAAVVVAVLVLVAGSAFAFGSLRSLLPSSEPTDYSGTGHGEVEVQIDQGSSGAQIGEALVEAGVVKTTGAFTKVAMSQPEEASQIQPGTYSMKLEMPASNAFDRLQDPDARVAKGVTIREGLWRSEIYAKLSKATKTPVSEYEKAEKSEKLKLPPQAEGKIEGWLFPSTYQFAEDETAVEQLNTMITTMVETLKEVGVPKDEWERTLTVASIVEGEAGAADRRKVARVVENRLAKPDGPTRGLLQMDSTIHYILQERGTVTTSDKARESDSPYNTYTNTGLPPGPINNPGEAAIKAANDPAEGDWFYFVTVDPETGETKFSETKAEHDENVEEFCANTDQCQ